MKRGRPPTGCPKWNADAKVWEAHLYNGGTTRKPVALPGIAEHDLEGARRLAKAVALRAREGGFVSAEAMETVNEYFERRHKVRSLKLSRPRDDWSAYWKWIAPVIGTKPAARIGRRDIEELVQALDRAVMAKRISGKRAKNVWGVVTKMFADACRSKVLDLRVRDDNPAANVEGPDRGIERTGPYPFPNEFLALMECERVPVRWKRLIMLALYTYVRAGELEALEWGAVNFEQGYISIHQAIDEKGKLKPTKGKNLRKVPIEHALLPLLRRMHDEAGGEGNVVTAMPPRELLASRLRKYFEWAGCKREDLYADDDLRRPLTWHDLRHGGLTWRVVRGDEALKVQRAAGHRFLSTTQRYINEAETFEGRAFGEPFPTVDLDLLSPFPGGAANTGPNSGIPLGTTRGTPAKQGAEGRPQGELHVTDTLGLRRWLRPEDCPVLEMSYVA
jgi:integrase